MNQLIPTFKSYCWSIGTTSFRTKDFNSNIERQLLMLDDFWAASENRGWRWEGCNELQQRYYNLMISRGFVCGDAVNPAKDAREKTSGLCDIGLLGKDRHISAAGRALLRIVAAGDFTPDNLLRLDSDSFVYLRQLLKMSCRVEGSPVRPFAVIARAVATPGLDGYVTNDEFTYLLPLAINENRYAGVISAITQIRAGQLTIDEFILSILQSMSNYQEARRLMMTEEISKDLMVAVGMNRKSRSKKRYDEAYYDVYVELRNIVLDKDVFAVGKLVTAIKSLRLSSKWWAALFGTSSRKAVELDPIGCLIPSDLTQAVDAAAFRAAFFDMMHLIKVKSNLADYTDLNRRYLSLSDVFIFADGKVSLDVLPGRFFALTFDTLAKISFTESSDLYADTPLEVIDAGFSVTEEQLLAEMSRFTGRNIMGLDEALYEVERERYRRLGRLVDKKFSVETLCGILSDIDARHDEAVRHAVTDNADVPTIFEYVVGLAWYRLSGCKGKILDYMRLSLDANLLPKTHAAGGGADIVYEYPDEKAYPAHHLLIEGTLSDKANQRRMEMEPVSRHLGDEIIASGNSHSYCVFVAPYLDPNVISDFRSRRTGVYYNRTDVTHYITGMKIIPLSTADLRAALRQGFTYAALYGRFALAYADETAKHPLAWYDSYVKVEK